MSAKSMPLVFVFVVIGGIFAAMPSSARVSEAAENGPLGDRFTVALGLYRPRIQTDVRFSDAAGNLGTEISFEDTLGMEDAKTTGFVFGKWRFLGRNSISIDYFTLNRDSNQPADVIIQVGDQFIDATLPIASTFDVSAVEINYAYSFIFTAKNDVSLGLGVSWQDLELGLRGIEDNCGQVTCPVVTRNVNSGVPLPTLEFRWSHAFTDQWILDMDAGWLAADFALDGSGEFDGRIITASAQARWKFAKHWALFGGYRYFDVDLDYDKRNLRSDLIYKYQGLTLGAALSF